MEYKDYNDYKENYIMVKSEMINAIVEKLNANEGLDEKTRKTITKKNAEMYLNTIVEVITDVLVAKDELVVRGLGKFYTKTQPPKSGTISFGERKGQTWQTEEKTVPAFKYASNLKTTVENA